MVRAFLDESGTHGTGLLCVAGYAGDQEEWIIFENEWSTYLRNNNFSSFHAKEPECEFLKPSLIEIISNRRLFGVVFSVDPDDYNAGFSKHLRELLGNAYAACAYLCVLEICKKVKINRLKDVSIVLEGGQPNVNHIVKILGRAKDNWDEMRSKYADMVEVVIAKKNAFIPLDAADFLAHSYSTHNKWFDFLLQHGNVFHKHMTMGKIKELSESKEILRTMLKNKKRD